MKNAPVSRDQSARPSDRAATIRLASLALVVWAIGAGGAAASQEAKSAAGPNSLKLFSQSLESLVKRVSPSVVQIVVTGYGPLEDTGRDNTDVVLGRQRSLGSGVIVDPDGYIVTNAHVVAGALHVQVTLPPPASNETPVHSLVSGRGRVLDATIVGTAPEVDLALLKVEPRGFPPCRSPTTTRCGRERSSSRSAVPRAFGIR